MLVYNITQVTTDNWESRSTPNQNKPKDKKTKEDKKQKYVIKTSTHLEQKKKR